MDSSHIQLLALYTVLTWMHLKKRFVKWGCMITISPIKSFPLFSWMKKKNKDQPLLNKRNRLDIYNTAWYSWTITAYMPTLLKRCHKISSVRKQFLNFAPLPPAELSQGKEERKTVCFLRLQFKISNTIFQLNLLKVLCLEVKALN